MNREDKWLCQTVKRKKSKKDGKYVYNREELERQLNPDGHTIALTEEAYFKWVVDVYADMRLKDNVFAGMMLYLMAECGAMMYGNKRDTSVKQESE